MGEIIILYRIFSWTEFLYNHLYYRYLSVGSEELGVIKAFRKNQEQV